MNTHSFIFKNNRDVLNESQVGNKNSLKDKEIFLLHVKKKHNIKLKNSIVTLNVTRDSFALFDVQFSLGMNV